ncbi:hypothetical protein LCGC14_2096100 [marine sediment metagenome]|uniref:Uncharacterized protein n=1 Tax=marine sediment metagenome TaxID=412755 RepID=A0A0F9EYN1_9ZZZZ
MFLVTWVIYAFDSISVFFQSIFWTISGWVWPFNLVASFFNNLAYRFLDVGSFFVNLGAWIDAVWLRMLQILSEWDIWTRFQQWFNWAEWAWSWILNAPTNIWGVIDNWWSSARLTIQDWINSATFTWVTLLNNVHFWLASLQKNWDDFWTLTYPNLLGISNAESLILSMFRSWFPFYDDLVSIKDELFSFFADPLQWLYSKLDEFFERFW